MRYPKQWQDPGSHKIVSSTTEISEIVEDADSPEGRELVREFGQHYDQGGAAPLDYKTWLPFAAKTYHISPNIEDYVLSVTPICPADIPNRNGIGFPIQELATFAPPPLNRMVYKCWAGCPTHYDHDNEDYTKAFGVVLDASLHRISRFGDKDLWKVMGLIATDKKKHPHMAQRVLNKDVDTYSMGTLSDYFTCSLCGTRQVFEGDKFISGCTHLNPEDGVVFYEYQDGDGHSRAVYRNAHGLQPFELSIVEDPAWPIALGDTLLRF